MFELTVTWSNGSGDPVLLGVLPFKTRRWQRKAWNEVPAAQSSPYYLEICDLRHELVAMKPITGATVEALFGEPLTLLKLKTLRRAA